MPDTLATAPTAPGRLLDAVRSACRVRHYSIRTEAAYASCAAFLPLPP